MDQTNITSEYERLLNDIQEMRQKNEVLQAELNAVLESGNYEIKSPRKIRSIEIYFCD